MSYVTNDARNLYPLEGYYNIGQFYIYKNCADPNNPFEINNIHGIALIVATYGKEEVQTRAGSPLQCCIKNNYKSGIDLCYITKPTSSGDSLSMDSIYIKPGATSSFLSLGSWPILVWW